MKEYNALLQRAADPTEEVWMNDQPGLLGNNGQATTFRIFYGDAVERSGITYQLDEHEQPFRVASRPSQRVSDGDIEGDVVSVADYLDGREITTYLDKGHLRLKAPMSFTAPYVENATRYVYENPMLGRFLLDCEDAGFTVVLDWSTPDWTNVLPVTSEKLTIVEIVNREDGTTLYFDDLPSNVYNDGVQWMKAEYSNTLAFDETFLALLDEDRSSKGVVVETTKGTYSIKSKWFKETEQLKSTINDNVELVKAILDNKQADLMLAFTHDKLAQERISEFESYVYTTLRTSTQLILDAHTQNKGRDRMFYMIEGQKRFSQHNWLYGVYTSLFDAPFGTDINEKVLETYRRHMIQLVPPAYRYGG